MSSEAVMEKLETLEDKLDSLQDEINEVKSGKQPGNKLRLKTDSGAPAKHTAKIIKKVKEGGKFDGLEVSEVEAVLQNEGKERKRKACLRFMRKIANAYPGFRFKKGTSRQGSELQYHKEKADKDRKEMEG